MLWAMEGRPCFGENLKRVFPRDKFDVNGDVDADKNRAIANGKLEN